MPPIAEWLRRVWFLLNRRRFQDQLRQEMDEHRASMAQPARFGNTLRLREDSSNAWGWRWLDDLGRDTRVAVRALGRTPGYAVVSISSLALGFVLVAATLAVVNAYLFRALPYGGADRLYHVRYAPPGPWEPAGLSGLDWTSVRDVVDFPITASSETFYLAGGTYAQSARGLRVAQPFVEGLEVRATFGRMLAAQDWEIAADPVALIGHAVWRDRYNSDPAIIGKTIRATTESRRGASETLRVIGVLQPNFYFGRDSLATVDLLVPLGTRTRTYMVRLKAGVPSGMAARRIADAARAVATDLPADWTGVQLESAHERYVAELRPILVGMTVGSALVLLLVVLNIGVLTLLRAMRRQKEFALRVALGSGRWRLTRMLAIEGALISGAAVVAGTLLANISLQLLAPVIARRLGRPAPGGSEALAVDGTVLLLLGALGALVALSLSFLPLLTSCQSRLGEVLRRDRASSSDGVSMRRLRAVLVAGEIAGTLVMLIGGGLLLRSATSMVRADLGFEPDALSRSRIVLRSADYASGPEFFRFFDQFSAAASVRANAPVVFASWPPFNELPTLSAETETQPGQGTRAGFMRVTAGFFGATGVPIQEGREFADKEIRTDAPVAVVSKALADRLWPNTSGVGHVVRGVEATPGGVRLGPWRTVIGVAGNWRHSYFDDDLADIYLPFAPQDFGRYGSFYIRTDRPTASLWATLRATAAEIDPNAVVDQPREVAAENEELAGARFLSTVLAIVAAAAVGLAVLGIYGVTSYSVNQRAREVAIRVALGATGGGIRRLFLKDTGTVLLFGILIGLALAAFLTGFVESYLYGVPARDVPTILASSALLAVVGIAAAWRPVTRALCASPIVVLQEG